MTPMELMIAALIVWWMLRRLVVDSAAAIRGHAPPRWNGTPGGGGGRGGSRRYGARGYAADLWSDAWQDARARRVARREARDATAGDAGGSRGSRLRQALGARWEAAWGRWEQRQNRRRGGDPPKAENRPGTGDRADGKPGENPPAAGDRPSGPARAGDEPTDPGGRSDTDTATRPDPPQPTEGQGRPDTASDGEQDGDPGAEPKEPTRVLDARRVGDRWVTDTDDGPASGAGPDPHQRQLGRDNQPPTTGGTPMSEATGLTTAIAYADDMSKANESNVAEAEGWAASLQTQGVSGPAVEAAQRAMEAQQQAADAWREAKSVLETHLGVKEQYDAHPDAGTREFVTSE